MLESNLVTTFVIIKAPTISPIFAFKGRLTISTDPQVKVAMTREK